MHLPANLKLFHGGAWHEPHGGYAPTMDPATNISLADAPLADASDVENCVRPGIGREECLEELLEFTQLKSYAVGLGT